MSNATDSPFPILPLGTSLVPGGLGTSFGAVIVANLVSAYLLGILTVQTYMYFNASFGDSTLVKSVVGFVWLLDIGQFAACVDFGWWYIVRNWGNVGALGLIRPSYGAEVILGSTIICIVELMFLRRVWILSKQSVVFTGSIFVLVMLQFVFGVYGGSRGVKVESFEAAQGSSWASAVVIIWLGSGLAADATLAAMLCWYLSQNRTGFDSTDSVLKKLIFFTMNTCLLTSIVALINIICFFTMRTNFIHVGFNMNLCKLFSNSLLASLNARQILRNDMNSNSFSGHRTGEFTFPITVQSQREVHVFRSEDSELNELRSPTSFNGPKSQGL